MKTDIILTIAMTIVTLFVGFMTFFVVEAKHQPAFFGVFVVSAFFSILMTISIIQDLRR